MSTVQDCLSNEEIAEVREMLAAWRGGRLGNKPVLLDQTQRALTTAEVAAVLSLDTRTVTRHARAGSIPGAFKPSAAVKTSKGNGQRIEWRFNRKVFLEWYEQQQSPGTQLFRSMQQKRQVTA